MALPSAGSGSVPAAGADINASPLATRLNNLYAFLNEASNIDEANVDLTGTDGIVGKSTAQTITGQKTFNAKTVFTGTYAKPIQIGTYYMWHDATNGCLRANSSAPSSETDGNIIMEG